jgi:predicted RNA-binding protein Jag
VASSPVTVHIAGDESAGLIFGRDGQTINALQYLANRIVSKSWPRSPRIQLDAGDYRQKQEEQLLSIAQFLSKSQEVRTGAEHQTLEFLPPPGGAHGPAGRPGRADAQQG